MTILHRITLAAVLLALPSAAQPAPHFDVVSIRVVPPDAPPLLRDPNETAVRPGGQYIDPRTPLLFLIQFAYQIPNDFRLLALPDWGKRQSYSISAKPAPGFPALPPARNTEQVRLMMRAMLADRFHLRVHSETRQESVFSLEVAKSGIKISEVDPPIPPAKEGFVGAAVGNTNGRMIGKKSTMTGIVKALEVFLKRPVIDRTGLKGYYDIDLNWNAPESPDGQPAAPGLGPDGIALLISTIQDRLGLRLTRTTGPVEYWIVDHVEPPTEN